MAEIIAESRASSLIAQRITPKRRALGDDENGSNFLKEKSISEMRQAAPAPVEPENR
jgi:hypothetical protein